VISRGEKVISGFSIDEIFSFVTDPKNITVINPNCIENKVLDNSEGCKLVYWRMKLIWPIDDRELVALSQVKKNGNQYHIVMRSINHDHPTQNDVVRAVCHLSSIFLEKIDDKNVRVVYMADINPKGDIPEMVKAKISTSKATVPANI
jgi:START domain